LQWKCCDVHVKEFDEFMEIPPCTKGWHNADAVWIHTMPRATFVSNLLACKRQISLQFLESFTCKCDKNIEDGLHYLAHSDCPEILLMLLVMLLLLSTWTWNQLLQLDLNWNCICSKLNAFIWLSKKQAMLALVEQCICCVATCVHITGAFGREFFYIFFLSRFCKNIWFVRNFAKLYICRRGSRRQE
jgi:hypothetical protein